MEGELDLRAIFESQRLETPTLRRGRGTDNDEIFLISVFPFSWCIVHKLVDSTQRWR
jgi:hypothetical protein